RVQAGASLPPGAGDPGGRPDGAVPSGVPPAHWLLDPGEIGPLLDLAGQAHRLVPTPALVDVVHHRRLVAVGAEHVAHDLQPEQVAVHVGAALDLGAGEPALGPGPVEVLQLVVRDPVVQSGGV